MKAFSLPIILPLIALGYDLVCSDMKVYSPAKRRQEETWMTMNNGEYKNNDYPLHPEPKIEYRSLHGPPMSIFRFRPNYRPQVRPLIPHQFRPQYSSRLQTQFRPQYSSRVQPQFRLQYPSRLSYPQSRPLIRSPIKAQFPPRVRQNRRYQRQFQHERQRLRPQLPQFRPRRRRFPKHRNQPPHKPFQRFINFNQPRKKQVVGRKKLNFMRQNMNLGKGPRKLNINNRRKQKIINAGNPNFKLQKKKQIKVQRKPIVKPKKFKVKPSGKKRFKLTKMQKTKNFQKKISNPPKISSRKSQMDSIFDILSLIGDNEKDENYDFDREDPRTPDEDSQYYPYKFRHKIPLTMAEYPPVISDDSETEYAQESTDELQSWPPYITEEIPEVTEFDETDEISEDFKPESGEQNQITTSATTIYYMASNTISSTNKEPSFNSSKVTAHSSTTSDDTTSNSYKTKTI